MEQAGSAVYEGPLEEDQMLSACDVASIFHLVHKRSNLLHIHLTARGQRASNPVFRNSQNLNLSETPSIALGDEAGSYMNRANPGDGIYIRASACAHTHVCMHVCT